MTNDILLNKLLSADIARQRSMGGRYDFVLNQEQPASESKAKSSAQVALCVEQRVVEHKACGLKPESSKSSRLAVRLSEAEREIVVRRAEKAGLTLSKYFRASILGPDFVSSTDPVKHELLRNVSRELGRQGNNFNQIAKQLNAGNVSPTEGNSMLAVIARSLLSAHQAVRKSLAERKEYE